MDVLFKNGPAFVGHIKCPQKAKPFLKALPRFLHKLKSLYTIHFKLSFLRHLKQMANPSWTVIRKISTTLGACRKSAERQSPEKLWQENILRRYIPAKATTLSTKH